MTSNTALGGRSITMEASCCIVRSFGQPRRF
jgi:hypothetical protein